MVRTGGTVYAYREGGHLRIRCFGRSHWGSGIRQQDRKRNRAGARCFGLVTELSLEAVGEAVNDGRKTLTIDHFADVYYARSNSDDDLNPFVSELWRTIDTRKTMDRWREAQEITKKSRRK